jgi:glyoxylate utilization-related uncharacterized protein
MQGEFELINLILEFAPGATTPLHTHGGPGVVTVIEGEIVFGVEGKADQVARPGEFYPDLPGTAHTAANKASTPARVSYVVALPKGAALTTVVGGTATPAQPQQLPANEHLGMPHTGAAVDSTSLVPMIIMAVVALALALLGVALIGVSRLSGARRP